LNEAARAAAAAVGAEHHELTLTTADVRDCIPATLAALDQPLADPAFVALWALAKFARREVTVAVGGEGADELFGGYPRYRWLARRATLPERVPRRLPASVVRSLARASGSARLARLGDVIVPGSTLERHIDWVTAERRNLRNQLYGPTLSDALAEADPLDPGLSIDFENGDIAGSLMRLDQLHWLPDDVLAKADRASMRASLELRTPFLSREVAEFAATVPAAVHVRGGGKLLLRRVLRQKVPTLQHAPKTAFRTPVAEWLRGPLGRAFDSHLDGSSLYRDGWFEPKTVAAWARSHSTGLDMSHALWPVFVLGCWYDANAA
jgi:asparagine synthase (glutamine-hydrolysing)